MISLPPFSPGSNIGAPAPSRVRATTTVSAIRRSARISRARRSFSASSTEYPAGNSHRASVDRSVASRASTRTHGRIILALLLGDPPKGSLATTAHAPEAARIAGFYAAFTSAIHAVYLDLPISWSRARAFWLGLVEEPY